MARGALGVTRSAARGCDRWWYLVLGMHAYVEVTVYTRAGVERGLTPARATPDGGISGRYNRDLGVGQGTAPNVSTSDSELKDSTLHQGEAVFRSEHR